MKRSGFDHPKTKNLAEALKIPICFARGVLESLWHVTAAYAPEGNIGRWTDEEIGRAMGWQGDPVPLIQALVYCRFLDASETQRLVVHDWKEHCDDGVRKYFSRKEKAALLQEETERAAGGRVQTCPDLSRQVQTGRDQSRQGPDLSPLPSLALPMPSKEHARKSSDRAMNGKQAEAEAAKVYDAYPRKVAKKAALLAILRAFRDIPPEDLLARTLAYAKATRGQEERFIPYPATWYNQGRWADNASTWGTGAAAPGRPVKVAGAEDEIAAGERRRLEALS